MPIESTTPADRQVVCGNSDCNASLTITEPGPDGWDAITEPDVSQPGRQLKVTGWRIIFRCSTCGSRTAIIREDAPQ